MAFLLSLMLAVSSLPPADLILFSARIWTGDPAQPGAQALAVKDGRIVAVGTDRKMLRLRGPKTTRPAALKAD